MFGFLSLILVVILGSVLVFSVSIASIETRNGRPAVKELIHLIVGTAQTVIQAYQLCQTLLLSISESATESFQNGVFDGIQLLE